MLAKATEFNSVIFSEKVSDFSVLSSYSLFGDKPKNACFDTVVNKFCSF